MKMKTTFDLTGGNLTHMTCSVSKDEPSLLYYNNMLYLEIK